MFDIRPVGYVIGLLVAALGATMLIPLAVDLYEGNGNANAFLESAVLSFAVGGFTALSCMSSAEDNLGRQQLFLLTTGVWVALPIFAAVPFVLGAPGASYTDAYFEAMSGLTTTGSTTFGELETLPRGVLLWRSMLQWMGGIGIVIVAMVFLPELRVGGMQIFQSEAFDTDGKVLPRATAIAAQISVIYAILTLACVLSYMIVGMQPFDAINHALTTVSTGGFSTTDASFGKFQGAPEYVASVFMFLACLPFVRYVQILAGSARPLLVDPQIRGFVWTSGVLTIAIFLFQLIADEAPIEPAFRESLFNVISIITGTGYASVDYQLWGAFPMTVFFLMGLIGGCAGSTGCSIKVFRHQILIASLKAQIQQVHSPNGLFRARYKGNVITEEILSSVMTFFVLFILLLGVFSVLLGMTGLDFVTSVSGAATAIANIGPGLGDMIGPAGNFVDIDPTAKWILSFAMLLGRLELLVVLTLFLPQFWRA
ncbi:TrkH family potassium uptake protein [Qingshengfaniella alkalisoli]|uniref:Trk system potassium uptake protein n=1 Tax=Qingshengfaniella alkalisoli TaxID=2599296 RepID=A0A5B8J047_9RHOB|nr:TrkH family potassium uptake protein [Qingshengfaniella alkalisoli]QDY70248.1 TrkH family potassium uptake protein [Qingshengfaniella alkalisoli]